MNDIAIRVENLSKQYRIGRAQQRHDTLRDAIAAAFQRANRPRFQRSNVRTFQRAKADTIWALKDVSFEVQRGEVVGIIGRNGAGKTTLLKILSRITEPTSGRAILHGRVGSLLEVGTGFHPELTGRENIYLSGAILGMRKAEVERKFDEIVGFSGVETFIDTPLKRYSSGMYVRLAFAVAAHLDPEILLVDEVLAVGDAAFQKKCLGKMGEVSSSGRTVVFVSHQMEMIEALCRRVVLLKSGSIVEEGKAGNVIARYLSGLRGGVLSPLRYRTDREGEGRLRFTDIWLQDEEGQRISALQVGHPLTIAAAFEVQDGCELHDLTVGIAINSIRNISVTLLDNSIAGDEFVGPISGNGQVVCHVPRMPLNVGLYTLNIFASSRMIIEDWIKDAGRFSIEPADFYGSGRIPDSNRLMLLDHEWQLLMQERA